MFDLLKIFLQKDIGVFRFFPSRCFSFDFSENNLLTLQHYGFPRVIWLAFIFIAYSCHYPVDTELIDRENNAINCINCIWFSTEVYGYFPFSFNLSIFLWIMVSLHGRWDVQFKQYPPQYGPILLAGCFRKDTTFSQNLVQ